MSDVIKRSDFIPEASDLRVGSQGTDVERLKTFLKRFGYMNRGKIEYEGIDNPPEPIETDDDPSTRSVQFPTNGTFDELTKEALAEFQAFYGLEKTGELNMETLGAMQTKRCGFPDLGEYTAEGRKWNKNNLTYGFINYGNDLNPSEVRQAVEQAFAMWAAETPLSFRRVSNVNSADIRIQFASGNHGDGASFDGASGVLAHAFYPPPNGGALAGDAHFDEAETWTINIPTGSGKIDLVTVAAHEFGHSLGLAHSNVSGSLMFPTYSGPHRFLHSDDMQGIRSIYGGYQIAQAPWIHGTSIQVERPQNLDSIVRAGFYTYLTGKENTTNWFHFAVPTPVIVDRKRLKIARAMLRCRTHSDKAIIRDVHLYDGFSKIASHNDVNLSGNQWFVKFGVASKPYVYWGLGISIGVEFKPGTARQRRMDFASAGFDLIE